MTEEQAKTKWCPMVRVWSSDRGGAAAGVNRDSGDVPYERKCCIASQCMMWRWNEAYKANGTPNPDPVQSPHGYCGMAGKPFPAVVAA